MSNMGVECVCRVGAQLGEGPIWSASEQAVWFVDIKGRRVHRYDVRAGALRSWPAPQDVGFIVPTSNGGFICGLKSGLHTFDPGTGAFQLLARVDSDQPRNRLNDACVDAAGRLWFGTMDDDETHPNGALYRFDARGLHRCDPGYVITNGPAVSPEGRTLYHVDTLQRIIYAFDLDERGNLSEQRVFTRIETPGAYPDGPIVDSVGCVWIALYGGFGVQRYSPDGAVLETIALPVANCTKAAFGGTDLRSLFLTTAWKGLSAEQKERQPLAGSLFHVRIATAGLPQHAVRCDV